MSPNTRDIHSMLPLLDRADSIVRWLNREEAESMIRAGEVELLGTPRKVRAVRWVSRLPDNPRKRYPVREAR